MSDTVSYVSSSGMSAGIFGRQDMASPPATAASLLAVCIPNVEVCLDESGNRVAVYNIEIRTKFNKYCVGRRYNEFRELFKVLEMKYGFTFREFPPRTWFRSLGDAFLEKRRMLLEEFIVSVLSLACRQTSPEFLEFIELTKLSSLR